MKKKANPMSETWTAAGMVRRRIKAGRPSKADMAFTSIQAVNRLVDEVEKARGIMEAHGLRKEDITAGLAYRTGESSDVAWMPKAGGLAVLLGGLEKSRLQPQFLGLIWRQIDRESGGVPVIWYVQFMWDASDTKLLNALAEEVKNGA